MLESTPILLKKTSKWIRTYHSIEMNKHVHDDNNNWNKNNVLKHNRPIRTNDFVLKMIPIRMIFIRDFLCVHAIVCFLSLFVFICVLSSFQHILYLWDLRCYIRLFTRDSDYISNTIKLSANDVSISLRQLSKATQMTGDARNRPQSNFPSFERNENQNKHRRQNRRNLIRSSLEMKWMNPIGC